MLDIEDIRNKCPRFSSWLESLIRHIRLQDK